MAFDGRSVDVQQRLARQRSNDSVSKTVGVAQTDQGSPCFGGTPDSPNLQGKSFSAKRLSVRISSRKNRGPTQSRPGDPEPATRVEDRGRTPGPGPSLSQASGHGLRDRGGGPEPWALTSTRLREERGCTPGVGSSVSQALGGPELYPRVGSSLYQASGGTGRTPGWALASTRLWEERGCTSGPLPGFGARVDERGRTPGWALASTRLRDMGGGPEPYPRAGSYPLPGFEARVDERGRTPGFGTRVEDRNRIPGPGPSLYQASGGPEWALASIRLREERGRTPGWAVASTRLRDRGRETEPYHRSGF
ncbi:hypothetical protein Bbelb_236090 [Branchiostoma belcheri]|nr:hypothetical protein Bbelb_236090 [Branchiostoma belcheri]